MDGWFMQSRSHMLTDDQKGRHNSQPLTANVVRSQCVYRCPKLEADFQGAFHALSYCVKTTCMRSVAMQVCMWCKPSNWSHVLDIVTWMTSKVTRFEWSGQDQRALFHTCFNGGRNSARALTTLAPAAGHGSLQLLVHLVSELARKRF